MSDEIHFCTEDARKLSFPDGLVRSFHAGPRFVEFTIDLTYFEGLGLIDDKCTLRCTSAVGVFCRRYQDKVWRELPVDSAGALRDVCEWSALDGDLVLAGFEKESGQWQEYSLPSFSLLGSASTPLGPQVRSKN
jgi:hypothetical protein